MLQNDASQAALNASGTTDARNDVDALPAGSPGPAAGNVISGSGTLTGATGADAGANVTVVAIQGEGGGAELTPAASGPMEVQGRYGTLTIDAQGNYSYVRNAGTADGVQDVFTYTIAGEGGARDQATLTILLTREGETIQPNQVVQTDDGVVILPAGVELSDIRVVGRDLVITLPDGSTMTIPNGAVFVPQLVIGDVEVPPANLAALLIDAEPKPAAGTPETLSSGGNFAGDVPPLDPGVPLGDLLPPTEMEFPIPEFEEVGQVLDREPEVGVNPPVQLDDETETAGIPGGTGDVSPDTANTPGTLSGSGGDGALTFDFTTVAVPAGLGFTFAEQPDGSILIQQNGVTVITVTLNADTGAYTVTQNAAIDHPGETAPGTENDLSFTIGYTVTDSDGDFAIGSLTINADDDTPTVTNVQTGPGVTLDETNATAGHVPGSFPLSATSASAAISATLAFGADGAASANSTVYALSLTGGGTTLASGLQTAVGDHAITLRLASSTSIVGEYNGTNVAFTITLNPNGTITVTQNVPLEHTLDGSSAAAHDDSLDLSGKVNATVTITDGDGDTATGTAPIGAGIVFKDDGPSIDVSVISEREPTLLTQDAETIGGASDTAVSSANFNNAFGLTFAGGADGAPTPALAYALDVTGYAGGPAGIDSGLDQGANSIFLYEIGGKVVGSTSATLAGVTADNTVFDVAVSSTGVVTLTQYSQIDHPAAGDPDGTDAPFADHILSLADTLVTLTASSTVTDNDGDTATDSATINIGANLQFADDGPDISAVLTGTQVRIDETDGVVAAGGEVDPAGGNLGTVTMTAASLYTVTTAHASADAPTTLSYALSLSSQGALSGLQVSSTDTAIRLWNIGGVVYGSTSATQAGVDTTNLSNVAFTVSINGSGDVTVTQFLAVEHTVPGSSHDEDSASIIQGALNIAITATDFDGDTDEASVDLGSRMVFEDDGPSIDVAAGADAGVILQTDDPQTIGGDTDTAVSSANFGSVFSIASSSGGSDGAASAPVLAYALDVTGFVNVGAGTAGIDSGLNQTGNNIYLYEIGGKVVGSTSATLGGVDAGNTVFDVAVSATGVVTLTQYSQIDHVNTDPSPTGTPFSDHLIWMADNLVTLTASSTITDNDGDTASDSATVNIGANLRFSDDGPDISATATTTQIRIDETDNVVAAGGETDGPGGNLGTVTMTAGSLYTVTTPHASADAPTTLSYALTVGSQGALSGLLVSSTDAAIRLWNIGGVVYGSTSTTQAGVDTTNLSNVAFTVSINASGDVTVTQYLAVEHTVPGASHDEDSAAMASGLINVQVTAEDFDDDTDVATVDIGSRIIFEDDGPSITVAASSDAGVLLTTQDADTIGTNTDTAASSANFGGIFSIGSSSGGSDGTASISSLSYTLDVTGFVNVGAGTAGIDSGLDQGANNIYLYEIGGKVVGSTSATLGGVTAGNTVFDVAVGSTGIVTLTQYSQINHPIADDPTATASPFADQLIWMADNLVTLTASATITDNDGDTATDTETANIGANLRFADDGPVAVADTNTVTEGGQTTGNVLIDGVDDSFGADGMGSIQGVAAGTSTATPISGGVGVPIVTSLGTLTLQANGNYTYVSNDNSVTTQQFDRFVYTIVDADGDTSTVTLVITINPVNLVPDNQTKTVNEAAMDTTITGSDVASGSVTGSQPGLTTETVTGQLTVAGAAPNGYVAQSVTTAYGKFVLNTDGSYTYTLTAPFDGPTLNNGTVTHPAVETFNYTVFDANGNSTSGTITIDVIDDVPSVDVTEGAEAGVLLETQDAQTIGAGVQDTDVTEADFSDVFNLTFVTGADGAATPTLSYALDVTGFVNVGAGTAGIDSGLNQTNNNIYLYEIGGKIVGSTAATLGAVTAGNTVFDVAVSGTGVVTLTQYSQVDHPVEGTTTAPFDDQFVSILDSLVTLTASSTITDGDGDQDSDSESIDIGANLRFYDDGPDVSVSATTTQIRIDETDGVVAAGGEVDPLGGANVGTVTMTAASLYTVTNPHASADAPTTYSYALTLSSQGVLSGLQLSSTDAAIRLWNIGGTIYGSTSTTVEGVNAGNTAFTVSINSSGDVTLTQFKGIEHPTPGASHDEDSVAMALNLLGVTVTATDFDGDTDSALVDIGNRIRFEDDGPRFGTVDATVQIDNDDTPVSLGNDLQIIIGTDSPNSGVAGPPVENPNDLEVADFEVRVNGDLLPVSDYSLTKGTEDANTANYTFSFTYDVSDTTTDTITGTLVFHKDTGKYDVTLDGPVQGFSTLETAEGTAFVGYTFNTSTEDNTQPEVAVTTILEESAPGAGDGFYVQFTGIAAGNGSHETIGDGTADGWVAGDLFSEGTSLHNSWVSVSNASNGVGGDTINGPDAINFNLYSSNPTGTFSGQYGNTPTASANDMFLVFDGIGSSDDLIVVLKLAADTNDDGVFDTFTTKAIVVGPEDFYRFDATNEANTVAALAGTNYQKVVNDIVALGGSNNNDGLVIIESNDYNTGTENWQIVGAQIVNTSADVDGTGIALDGAIGAAGSSDQNNDGDFTDAAEQADFSIVENTAPMKITNIGFVAGTSNDQNAEIDFDVIITDADGDTATQHISIDIGDTSVNTTTLAAASTMVVSQETDTEQQLKSMNAANNNTALLGVIAGAGLIEAAAAAEAPAGDVSTLSVGDDLGAESLAATSGFTESNADDSRDLLSGETQELDASAADLPEAANRGQDVAAEARTLVDSEAENHGVPVDLLEATDTPAAGHAPAAAPAEVAMPSIDMLVEAFAKGADGAGSQHTQELGRVLADALAGGGDGPDLDAVIEAAGGKANGPQDGLDALATVAGGDVSGWDMAGMPGFTNGHGMSMEAMLVHPDAPAHAA